MNTAPAGKFERERASIVKENVFHFQDLDFYNNLFKNGIYY